ncbi:MAG: oxidoreductase, partial [Gemmatimonadetes bacterium]|nr:oxidoreductase [Gemmatimonadota bacterium]
MPTSPARRPEPQDEEATTLIEQIRAAADLLEAIAADRALLVEADAADRLRLLKAAGQVSRPDALDRRRMVLATRRERKAAKVQRAESVLTETGIRKLRGQPVFSTPRLFAPVDFEQQDVTGEAHFREALEPRNCYVCKQDYSALHHFYDQLCPSCAELNYHKRTETADL